MRVWAGLFGERRPQPSVTHRKSVLSFVVVIHVSMILVESSCILVSGGTPSLDFAMAPKTLTGLRVSLGDSLWFRFYAMVSGARALTMIGGYRRGGSKERIIYSVRMRVRIYGPYTRGSSQEVFCPQGSSTGRRTPNLLISHSLWSCSPSGSRSATTVSPVPLQSCQGRSLGVVTMPSKADYLQK